jgi:hypothetical protein
VDTKEAIDNNRLVTTYDSFGMQLLLQYPIKHTDLPKPGDKRVINGRTYTWVQISEDIGRYKEDIILAFRSLKEGEALELGFEVYLYPIDKTCRKLFKKDTTPHYIPEDAVKMPNNMEVATKELSEKVVTAGAEQLANFLKLDLQRSGYLQ